MGYEVLRFHNGEEASIVSHERTTHLMQRIIEELVLVAVVTLKLGN